MVLGAGRLSLTLAIALILALPATAAAPDRTEPEPVAPTDPILAQLPAPPANIRLHAQTSSEGDAFLTVRPPVLPLAYTPPMRNDPAPALVFEAFRHVTTNADGDSVQYGSRAVRSAWDTTLAPDVPIVAEWLLSTGARGIDPTLSAPPILVTTTVKAVDADGFSRVLAARSVRAQPSPDGPTPVRMEMPHLDVPIPQGSSILVELDWSWARASGIGALRQPLITVHPGSWMDLPISDPVRILSIDERVVSGALYVEAQVAHLFAVEDLALGGTNLVLSGPGVQMQGGRALVEAPIHGPDAGHIATFDWRVPVDLGQLSDGTYALYVTAAQAQEEGPRAAAKRTLVVSEGLLDATPPAAWTQGPSLVALLMLAAATVWALQRMRRVGA